MPALAQTKPWWVSTISTPRSARSTSRLSARISSTRARLLAERRRQAPRLGAGQHRGEPADPSLGLGDDLLRDDDHVALAQLGRRRDQGAELRALVDLRQAGDRQ